MKKIIYLYFFAALIISCTNSTVLTDAQKAIVIKEVNTTLENYYNDIRKSGLLAEFKYLDSSADFFWVPPGYTKAISYQSVASTLKQNAHNYKLIDNKFDSLVIKPLNFEIATYTGLIKSNTIDNKGTVMTFSLMETGVVIKRKNGWKLLSGQTFLVK